MSGNAAKCQRCGLTNCSCVGGYGGPLRPSAARERWLSYLRMFRGYTEDEARLAAWAADEIERLEKIVRDHWSPEQAEKLISGGPKP